MQFTKLLGKGNKQIKQAYQALFKNYLSVAEIDFIREATAKKNVIGQNYFSDEIEKMLKRRVNVGAHGGDRKNKAYQLL